LNDVTIGKKKCTAVHFSHKTGSDCCCTRGLRISDIPINSDIIDTQNDDHC